MCLPSSRTKLQSSQRIHRESECLGPKKKCIPPISNLVLFSLVVCCFELSKKCAWPGLHLQSHERCRRRTRTLQLSPLRGSFTRCLEKVCLKKERLSRESKGLSLRPHIHKTYVLFLFNQTDLCLSNRMSFVRESEPEAASET